MRTKIILIATLFCAGTFSCDDETAITDPIYEFVSFTGGSSVNLNEFANSENPFPLTAKLLAFKPYPQDIDLTLEISGSNAAENTDFIVTPSDVIKIRAGKLVSDTIWIKTVDNAAGDNGARTFQVRISAVSQPDVKIGLGLADPENSSVTFSILDDECSLTTAIYNTTLNNKINDGATRSAVGVLTGNTLKLTGDLIDYGAFANATLSVNLTPDGPGATKGQATFGEQEAGSDSDGYQYKFIEVGEGSYDVCSGSVTIEYDIYYMDGDWTYWYSVTNVFSVP